MSGIALGCSSAPTHVSAGEVAHDPVMFDAAPIGWAAVDDLGQVGTTGGEGGAVVQATTTAELIGFAQRPEPLVIQVSGSVGEGARIALGSNKTLIGVGDRPTLLGALDIKDAQNVIVRNLFFVGCDPDGFTGTQTQPDCIGVRRSHHVWIDHVDVSDGSDGNLDVTEQSDYVTISWTKFSYSSGTREHRFSNLIGSDDSVMADLGKLRVTFHHDWWADNVVERMPRVRYGQIHLFNNLYTSKNDNYCVRAGVYANILTESNLFLGVNDPIESIRESNEQTVVVSRGNLYVGVMGSTQDKGAGVFTPPYPYELDDVGTAEAVIKNGAGPCLAPLVFDPAALTCQ